MRRFFELHRKWPESFSSLTIVRDPASETSHLEVYEHACDESYLKNFQVTRYHSGCIPDVLPNNNGWLIVSPEFCRALNNTDAEIKAFITPIANIVPMFCPDIIKSYSLLSVSRVIDCLDIRSPDLDWFDHKRSLVEKYRSLRFHKDKIPPGISFFGLARVPVVHIVSDEIHSNIVNANLTGVSFRECELI
jgi:hypothetical protein